MKTAASPATQVSVFFAGMGVIGPAWPGSSVRQEEFTIGRSWLFVMF